MATVFDVPADGLVEEIAKKLKSEFKEIQPPEWTPFVKTSAAKQRAPEEEEWWFKRCASVLRKIYLGGPIGISKTRTIYGGRKDRGRKPEQFRKGSGSIVRNVFKQLQEAGLVEKIDKGRIMTAKGRSFIDKTAYDLYVQINKPVKKVKETKSSKERVKKGATKK
jgi:small subunit ribosomal protein S19e